MNRVSVAIPVLAVSFEVEVMQQAGLLPLDALVLAGLGSGMNRAPSLAEEFRLSPRLIDASIVRLIDEDLLRFNPASGELALSDLALVACKEDRLEQLAFRGEPRREKFRAVQDLTWGGVVELDLNRQGIRLGAPGDAICLPRNQDFESALQFTPSKVAALYNARRRPGASTEERPVAINGRLVASSSSHLVWELLLYRNGDAIDIGPAWPDSNWSPPSLRVLLARIRRWLHEHPDQWQHLAPAAATPTSAGGRLRLFVPFTDYGPLVELEELSRHAAPDEEEGSLVSELREQCARLYSNRAVIRLVQNEGHVEQCRELLGAAQDFCIVHSAFWSDAGVNQYREEILAALKKGVDVYLLRGLGDDEGSSTAPTSLGQLTADAAGYEGRLLISSAPHHSHAKFVVADGRAAVVSSFNFLGATRDNPQLNVGVCCAASTVGQGIGLTVLRNLMEHALPGDLLSHLEEQVTRLELLGRLIDSEQRIPGPDPLPAIREWIDTLREPKCAWELVANEGHRDALLAALHTAQRSVTITSGDLTRSAVDAVVQGYLKEAVHRGVTVKVLWGSQTRDPDEQAQMAALAAELQHTLGGDRFVINPVHRPVHAKLLVVDGWVSVVSSYNFLSYRGLRFGAHELGLKIYSLALARDLERLVNEALSK